MPILYVETNFLMSIATGRDPDAASVMSSPSPLLRIVMPGICYMEALTTLESERRSTHQFKEMLKARINQARRDLTSVYAQSLRLHLERALAEVVRQFNDVEVRLFQGMSDLSRRVALIEPDRDIIESSIRERILEDELTDNLILHCVLHHAALNSDEERALLSENTRDFGREDVRRMLRNADVKYFSKAKSFLDWLGAQPPA
jgi:superfamily I DNA and/or RNA helicase